MATTPPEEIGRGAAACSRGARSPGTRRGPKPDGDYSTPRLRPSCRLLGARARRERSLARGREARGFPGRASCEPGGRWVRFAPGCACRTIQRTHLDICENGVNHVHLELAPAKPTASSSPSHAVASSWPCLERLRTWRPWDGSPEPDALRPGERRYGQSPGRMRFEVGGSTAARVGHVRIRGVVYTSGRLSNEATVSSTALGARVRDEQPAGLLRTCVTRLVACGSWRRIGSVKARWPARLGGRGRALLIADTAAKKTERAAECAPG